MKIKITCCPVDTYWYKDKIGEEFEVITAVIYPEGEGFGFQVTHNDGKSYVDVEDAQIVFEEFL